MSTRLVLIFNKLILYGLIFLVVFIPFIPVSTVPLSFEMPWSLAVTALIVLALVALWLFKEIYQGTLTFTWTPLNLPILAFVILTLFQLAPLPPGLLHFFSPATVDVVRTTGNDDYENISKILKNDNTAISLVDNQILSHDDAQNKRWHSITLYRHASKVELFRLLIYIGVFFLIVNNVHSKHQIFQIILSIIFSALTISFLGILQYVSKTEKVFWLLDIKRTNFFGTFSNRDHFACYMAMVIPLILGLLVIEFLHHTDKESSSRHRLSSITSGHKVLFYVFAIVIMLSSLFLARSGGAAFTIMISFLLFAGMMQYRKRLRKLSWMFVPLFIVVFGMLLWIGIQPVVEKLSTTVDVENPSLTARLEFWKDTLTAIKDFPVFGAGIGVFPFIYPHYSTVPFELSGFINHAHNEYFELMLETGIIGFTIILWALYRFIKDTAFHHVIGITNGIGHTQTYHKKFGVKESFKKRNDPFIIGTAMGGIIGVISMSIHNIVDFNFHVPACAFLLSVLLGITMVAVHMKHNNIT
ncbi:MAG: O-antigen ligase family protein [Candidatus Brocadiaceae bacterium]